MESIYSTVEIKTAKMFASENVTGISKKTVTTSTEKESQNKSPFQERKGKD